MRPDQEEFFTVLYREYFNQIKLYAMAHISDPHRAEEIAQDTFHTAVEKIDTLMKADEPIRWLKRTAKNKIRNEQRTRQRYLKRYLSLDAPETPAVSSAGSVEDAIIEQEDKQNQRQDNEAGCVKNDVLFAAFYFLFCHCGIFFTHVFVSSYHRLLPESLSDIVLTMISITMFTMVLNRPIAEEYDISLLIRPTL